MIYHGKYMPITITARAVNFACGPIIPQSYHFFDYFLYVNSSLKVTPLGLKELSL
jgi:hypothetical protein